MGDWHWAGWIQWDQWWLWPYGMVLNMGASLRIPTYDESDCIDVHVWEDDSGLTCEDWDVQHCIHHGNETFPGYPGFPLSANEACCVCQEAEDYELYWGWVYTGQHYEYVNQNGGAWFAYTVLWEGWH